ncbi:protein of unknown function [Maridesulfovibrio hydrothermalis AM13 = DSM 14728]|uniref:Helicase C-terminal domain-containing protein n=1 Tax=Maridesulfovibrio hydrothermalis AM13 = DSM 14728 TaxID=1121451 RepID=L0RCY7_9BACT|nr:protein of unknown function [Maridesulfovibrio hydrothermalis AM13 = DSM 14728]
MGIDIGSVKSVAQIGPPPSVASLCQRIGRSGRQEGDPAILRTYIQEEYGVHDMEGRSDLFHHIFVAAKRKTSGG